MSVYQLVMKKHDDVTQVVRLAPLVVMRTSLKTDEGDRVFAVLLLI